MHRIYLISTFRDSHLAHQRAPGLILLLIFSSLLVFRILLRMTPGEHAIYYNGPVVLSFLLLPHPLIPQSGSGHRFVFPAELLLCQGCLAVPPLYTRKVVTETAGWVPLTTERGTIVVKKVWRSNIARAFDS